MAAKVNLKWQNRFSGEVGYVRTVSPKDGCFYNTFDKSKAKKYTSESVLSRDLTFLKGIGEMHNNLFTTEPA